MNKITTCELAMATCIKEERYVAMISCGMLDIYIEAKLAKIHVQVCAVLLEWA